MSHYRELLYKLQTDLNDLDVSAFNPEEQGLIEEIKTEIAQVLNDQDPSDDLLHRLRFMVTRFEATHPRLTAFVDQVSSVLSNMGL